MAAMVVVAVGTTALCGAGLLVWYWAKPRSKEAVPAKMKRLVVVEANEDSAKARLEVQEVDTPKPRRGQVLVKVAAAPVNPSDEGNWRMEPKSGYPVALGLEGSGQVVASGGGIAASRLLGRAVAGKLSSGSYAEYAVADALQLFSLPSDLPVEDGCAFLVNPCTVVGLVETMREHGGKALIQTAAASQLGQMMVRYCQSEGVTLVNLVRRPEQVELLKGLGAQHIISTAEEDWQAQLSAKVRDLKVKFAADAVGGDMPGTLLSLLPPGGAVCVYGGLAGKHVGNIHPLDLIYRQKKIEGWFLSGWMSKGGSVKALLRTTHAGGLVRKHLKGIFSSAFKDTTLADCHADYSASLTSGKTGTKLRVRPNSS